MVEINGVLVKRLVVVVCLLLLVSSCFCENIEEQIINSWYLLEDELSSEPCDDNESYLINLKEMIDFYKASEIYQFSLTQKTNDVLLINNIADSINNAIVYNRNRDFDGFNSEILLINNNMMGFIRVTNKAIEKSSYLLSLVLTLFSIFVVFVFFLVIKLQQTKQKVETEKNNGLIALQAKENECNRISHELHDTVVQDIRTMQLYTSELKKHTNLLDDSNANEAFSKIEILEERSLDNITTIIKNLVPPVFDNIEFKALTSRLCQETTDFFKIKCVFSVINPETPDAQVGDLLELLPQETKLHLYRIIQEAVNNAVKYAAPSEIHVHIREESYKRKIIIFIDDDGCGIESSKENARSTKLGLKGMKMRASLMNAKISIESDSATGTCIRVELSV